MSMEASLATWEIQADISAMEQLLLLSFARRAGEDHTCWPSLKRISSDTKMDRKAIISNRQKLIDKKLIRYTGEMKGRSGQIPVMELTYVNEWERKRNSPRLDDDDVDNSPKKKLTSTESGTGTSTESGTLNIKEEYKRGREAKSMLSDSFKPNEEAVKLAQERRVDLNDSFEVFRNYAKSRNRKETDWNRALINWIINEKNKIKPINDKMAVKETKSTVPFWEPGNPNYDSVNGKK